ncbi:hypothetical protein QWY90_04285 [Flavobacterium paronense]|uniref:Lipoprotein n=1 Tax=Flavobacterium paronense TaxID=1392775 RepID=A0ABV5GH84_9FLAO|nr:hypothetical protein [Flavobacterium paronense]MDN3676524.1 hypothetical protein [Flavobacterium paronense]
MKKLLVCLLALFLTSCVGHAQITKKEIGVVEKDIYKITIDKSFLKKVLEEKLRAIKNNAVLTEFEIVKDSFVNDPSRVYYILVAQDNMGSTKIAFDLALNDNVFVASFKDNVLLSGTCTCSGGCTRGCNPRHEVGPGNVIDWYCDACRKGSGCSKSVTTSLE